MPADASIFQNFLRAPKSVQDYDNEAMQAQSNALAMKTQQAQYNALAQQQQDDQALRNYLAGGAKLDTPEGQAGLYRVAPKAAGGILKSQAEIAKENAAAGKDKALAAKAAQELIGESIKNSRVNLEGVTTPEQYIAWHEANHKDPVLGPYLESRGVTVDQARARINQAIQTPDGFIQLINESKLGAEKAYANAMQEKTLAETVRHNTTSEGLTKRGQNMVDARTREANQANMSKPFEVTGQDGQPMLVQQDKQGNIRPVQGYGPKAQPDKPLNDSQSKALLFGSRAREADNVLAKLANDGTNASIPGSRAPIVGGIINAFQGGNQQSLDQAKRDFMTAVLRRESGASIAPSEFDTADKQYFPQVGDSEKVIKQKAANRRLVIDGILSEVPEKQRGSLTTPTQQNASADPKPAPANLPKSNSKGWALHVDAKGNRAYVSPDGKQYEEVK